MIQQRTIFVVRLSPERDAEIAAADAAGVPRVEIARRFGHAHTTVMRSLARTARRTGVPTAPAQGRRWRETPAPLRAILAALIAAGHTPGSAARVCRSAGLRVSRSLAYKLFPSNGTTP